MDQKTLLNVREKAPLVHAMTNGVSLNDCANILLACGASPIMADVSSEVEEVTARSDCLVLNLGMLHEKKLHAMCMAAGIANEKGIPIVLDPVGIGNSAFRMSAVRTLLNQARVRVIRGNCSEIAALMDNAHTQKGVDANPHEDMNVCRRIQLARAASARFESIVVLTGEQDVVTEAGRTYVVRNGHAWMRRITGTGCMLSALIGAYVGANDDALDATVSAVAVMGVCAELAADRAQREGRGTGSMRVYLIDAISLLTQEELEGGCNIALYQGSSLALRGDGPQ